ncbi:MAG: hypothetical protein ACTHYM_14015 [Actinomycetaceae bacterium]
MSNNLLDLLREDDQRGDPLSPASLSWLHYPASCLHCRKESSAGSVDRTCSDPERIPGAPKGTCLRQAVEIRNIRYALTNGGEHLETYLERARAVRVNVDALLREQRRPPTPPTTIQVAATAARPNAPAAPSETDAHLTAWEVVRRTSDPLGREYLHLLMTGECHRSTLASGETGRLPRGTVPREHYTATAKGVWVGRGVNDAQGKPDATWRQLRDELHQRLGPADFEELWQRDRSTWNAYLAQVDEVREAWTDGTITSQQQERDRSLYSAHFTAERAAVDALRAAVAAAPTDELDDFGTPSMLGLLDEPATSRHETKQPRWWTTTSAPPTSRADTPTARYRPADQLQARPGLER